jgi:hypothetical protein
MKVEGIDERCLGQSRDGADFLVFIYEGGDRVSTSPSGEQVNFSWSVDSLLLTDCDLPGALGWLRVNLPVNCCWSLGVVLQPQQPTTDSELTVSWVVGADVLNLSPHTWSPEERRLAEEMLTRRHHVSLA